MTRDDYIITICDAVAKKSSCEKRKVGAVFVDSDGIILSTGFNETPRGEPKCEGLHKCLDINNKCNQTIHAEMNAIINAARNGTSLKGSSLYVTRAPCLNCSRFIINIGVLKVYYREGVPEKIIKNKCVQLGVYMT
jgi:dCMP deaminase